MIPYILHVSILIAAGLLFYKLALKKLTFYVLNRWVLLTCLVAAFLMPLMPVPKQLSWWKAVIKPEAAEELKPVVVADVPGVETISRGGTVVNGETTMNPASTVRPVNPARSTNAAKPTIPAPPKSSARSETTIGPEPAAKPVTTAKPEPSARLEPTARPSTSAKPSNAVDPKASVHPDPGADSKIPVVPRTTAGLQTGPKSTISILKILFYLYLAGAVVLGCNLLRQMIQVWLQSSKGPVIRDGNYRIVTNAGMQGPCSFGNIIFIHPSQYDQETYRQILLHEKIHAGGWHTVDILLAELGIIFQWFNPCIWLFRREMENNLEFLTDRNVLRHPGVERTAYQLSLVKVAVPDMSLNITSNYNQSLLKRRIIMMNAQHSSRHTAWKYFFLLPIFILLAALLNRPQVLAQTVKMHAASAPAKASAVKTPSAATAAPVATAAGAAAPAALPDTIPAASGDPYSVVSISRITDVYPEVQSVVHTTAITPVTPNVMTTSEVSVTPEVHVTIPTLATASWSGSDTSKPSWADRTEGAWFIVSGSQDKKDDKINIELRGENDDHNWNSNFSVPKNQLTSLNGVGKVDFSLTREAGTIHFTGQFDGEQGFGHYKFQPDAAYLAHMREKKLVDRGDELMSFFIVDIKKSYVDMLQANGFPDISKGHLISMAALHIDETFIRSIRESGYKDITEGQLITFQALHIDKTFIDYLRRAGYDHLQASEVITFKSLKIDGDYLRKFPSSTPVHDIITYRSLHIDSEYVASLKRAGYPDLSSRDIVTMKSMKIDADYIKGFNSIGYRDLPVHSLVSFKSMDITPEYVKGFTDMGYQDMPANTLISFKSLGITPEYVKSFQAVGFKDISRESLTSMKSLNITPVYVKSFMDLGYKDINPHQLTSLKAMNITPDFVRSLNAIGFKDIPLHQLTSLKAMGITADYITKMKEKGFVSDDLNKYIRLKNAFE